MENGRIARMLDDIGTFIELTEDNTFRARAYHNASRVVDGLEGDVEELTRTGEITKVAGLGKEMLRHINEYLSTGSMSQYDEFMATIPAGMVEMLRIPGLGPKRIRVLHDELKIDTVEGLAAACKDGRVAAVSGFGAKTQEKILKGIDFLSQHQDSFNYAEAEAVATSVIATLRELPGVMRVSIAGSLRRHKEIVHDVDAVMSVADDEARTAVMAAFVGLPEVTTIMGHGDTKSSVVFASGLQMDLRVVNDDEFASALHHFTGSKDHNVALRGRAVDMGIKINEYGLWRGEERLSITNETELYATLGMAYIEPELREERGEIQAALTGTLPTLVTEKDIQGVLHCHSTWSDGHATLREMAEAARTRGYHYIGICDHSQVAAYAHGLSPESVRRQHEEIDALNAEYAGAFRIIKGTECDILKNGSLDYDDEVLAQFEFVVGSIHSVFNLSEAEETARLVKAIQNPYLTFLGHPTGRLLLRRDGYAVDIPAVIAAAAKRGVGIEVNANPARFDMDWRWHRQATEQGVMIPICPDAHATNGLDDMRYGVGIARKGWLGPQNVPNAWPLEKLMNWFAEVRERGKLTENG